MTTNITIVKILYKFSCWKDSNPKAIPSFQIKCKFRNFDENISELKFFEHVVFVAIKNGMHDSKGYIFSSSKPTIEISKKPIHVSVLNQIILSYFQGFDNNLT